MRFFNVAATILLASAGFAAAEKCQAQNILDTCLETTKPGVEKCSSNDWECLCDAYNNVLTCYNNCPEDEGKFGVQSQVTANCNAAKSTKPSSSSSSSSGFESEPTMASSSSNRKSGGSGDDGNKKDENASGTATESGAAETSTGAASVMNVEAGGLAAAVLVGLGAWL